MTFDRILAQAQVSLDPRGYGLAKEHWNCAATSRLLVAVRAYVDSVNEADAKHEKEKARLANENSTLAAKVAELEREVAEAKLCSVRRGLEAMPEISQSQGERALSFNGS